MDDEVVCSCAPTATAPGCWDVYHGKRLFVTEPTEEAALLSLEALRKNGWRWLDKYHTGLTPTQLIKAVYERRGAMTWRLGRFPSGQLLFKGQLDTRDSFEYLLFDPLLEERIRTALQPFSRPASAPVQPRSSTTRPASPASTAHAPVHAPAHPKAKSPAPKTPSTTVAKGSQPKSRPAGSSPGPKKPAPPPDQQFSLFG